MPRSWRAIPVLLFAVGSAATAQTLSVDYFTHAADLGRVAIAPDGKVLAATHEVEGQSRLAFLNLEQLGDVREVIAPEGMEFHDFQWISALRVLYRLSVRQPGLGRAVTTGELLAIDRDGTKPQYVYGCQYVNGGRDSGLELSTHLQAPGAPDTAPADAATDSADSGLRPSCGTGELLSSLPGDDRNVLVAQYLWLKDGRQYRHDPDAAPSVALIDTYDGSETILERLSLRGGRVLVDGDDRARFAAGRDEADELSIAWRPEPEGRWESFGLADFAPRAFMPQRLAADGRAAFFIGRQTRDSRKALYRLDLPSHKAKKLYEHPAVDVDTVIEDLAQETVIGVRLEADRPEYHWLDEAHPSVKLYETMQRAFPDQSVEITSVTDDRRQAIVLVQSDVNPGDYYLLDTQTRKAQYLRSARSWVDPAKMRHKEAVALKARDGAVLHGYLTRPYDEAGPYPLLVVPHAGPYGMRDGWRFDWEVQLFAHYGFAVLQVNYRGSGGYGDEFMHAGFREWGGKMQDDLTDATRWAIERKITAEDNVCIFGSGYGGYAALMGVAREPKLYRCAAGYDGLYDLEQVVTQDQAKSTNAAARRYLDEILGSDLRVLRERSPLYNAARIEAPVLLIVPSTEGRIEQLHAARMKVALLKESKAVESAVIDGPAGVYTKLLEFFARHLHGRGISPDLAPGAVRPAG